MLSALVQVLAAYLFADLCTGIYHFATDRGWNTRKVVALFQNHHETNTMDGFDWQPMWAGVPFLALGLCLGWLELPLASFFIAGGSFGILAQVPHYYAHRRSRSLRVHRIVRWLQETGLIISPEHHSAHHDGKFDCNFCILSGWNNWWFNHVARVL